MAKTCDYPWPSLLNLPSPDTAVIRLDEPPRPRRGPSRFIDGTPAAYRPLDLQEGPVPPQVADLVAAAEYDLEDYKEARPILIIHSGPPDLSVSELSEGLTSFQSALGRPTWLKVSYFTGREIIPVEPPESLA